MNTRKIVIIGMLSALAFFLQLLIVPYRVAGFLDIEISDLPAVIGTLAYGPLIGVLIELIKNILHLFVTTTGMIGEAANFVMNGMFVLAIGMVYKFNKTKKGAYIALLVGVLAMTIGGIFANLFIMIPSFMPTAPFGAKLNLVLYTITPFNIVKGIVIALITMLIYKRISPLIK